MLLAGVALRCGGDSPEDHGSAPEDVRIARIGVIFGEPFEGHEEALYAAARSRGRELDVRRAHGRVAATELAVQSLIEQRVSAIVLYPSAPELLQRARKLAAERSVPLLLAMRSDGRSGPFAGILSGEQAEPLGERAAARLAVDGVLTPSVVAFEDPRWPESRRRVESTLDAVERKLGKVEVRLRVFEEGGVEPSLEKAMARLARVGRVDLFLAGDPASTRVALEAARRMGLDVTATVAGISDDPALLTAAERSTRTFLVGCDRAACAAAILDGVAKLEGGPSPAEGDASPRFPVAATLHGPQVAPTPAGGP
jgi:DNA-binding LacI/PurR family transcriptional regulator